jgi:hypothetical protein
MSLNLRQRITPWSTFDSLSRCLRPDWPEFRRGELALSSGRKVGHSENGKTHCPPQVGLVQALCRCRRTPFVTLESFVCSASPKAASYSCCEIPISFRTSLWFPGGEDTPPKGRYFWPVPGGFRRSELAALARRELLKSWATACACSCARARPTPKARDAMVTSPSAPYAPIAAGLRLRAMPPAMFFARLTAMSASGSAPSADRPQVGPGSATVHSYDNAAGELGL